MTTTKKQIELFPTQPTEVAVDTIIKQLAHAIDEATAITVFSDSERRAVLLAASRAFSEAAVSMDDIVETESE